MLLCNDCQINRTERANIQSFAQNVFDCVWRFDFKAPGFAMIDLGPNLDSHALRSMMIELKEQLSESLVRRMSKKFAYLSMGRFDQQQTTKYHLDGAPDQSLLMLGYEPSKVRSRLFLADYTKCAYDRGIDPKQILADYNPMFARGQEMLASYIVELAGLEEGHSRLLLINNSSLPYSPSCANPLGVMHKAEIVSPNPAQSRIVNSIMLTTADTSAAEVFGPDQQMEFVQTERISQKVY